MPAVDFKKLEAQERAYLQMRRRQIRKGILTGLLLLGAVVAYAWWVHTAGAREFARSRAALQAVSSWRMKGELGSENSHFQTLEVACPDREHMINRIVGRSPEGKAIESVEETIRIASTSYSRIFVQIRGNTVAPETSGWDSAATPGGLSICQRLAAGQAADPLPDFVRLTDTASISRGDLETVGVTQCRVWHVHQPSQKDGADDQKICIGVSDHLPRRIKSSQAEYVFSDWNAPVTIAEPRFQSASARR